MSQDLASRSPWKSSSAPSLLTASQASSPVRRPTGLLSAAAAEFLGDGRAGTPATRSRLSSRQGDSLGASPDCRPSTSSFGWPRGAQVGKSAWLSAASSSSCSPNKSRQMIDKLDFRISQEFQAEQLGNPSSPSRPGTRQNNGPSAAALLENFKKERYNQHIELNKKAACTGRREVLTVGGEIDEIKKHKAEEFLREVGVFEHKLQDCARSIRLEHLDKDPKEVEADRIRAERTAHKQWEEAEMRKARKKEQMARDPHRKIQLRLENKRRFEMDTLDKAGIPTQNLAFSGGKGAELITVVDVRHLQAQCQGLNETGGVRTLLELAERREKLERMMAFKPSTTMSSMSTMQSTARTLDSAPSSLSGTWEERLPVVHTQKDEVYKDSMRRRLYQMRQPTPSRFPHQLFRPVDLEPAKPEVETFVRRMACVRNVEGLDEIEFDEEGNERSRKMFPSELTTTWRPTASPEVVAKARKGWVQARGFVGFLKVYFRHMRQSRAIHAVVGFLHHVGEWARIKNATVTLLKQVRIIQRYSREFLARREKRCAGMIKDWQRAEDAFLQGYFKVYAVHAIDEHAQKLEQDAQSGLSAHAKAHPGQSLSYKKARAKVGPGTSRTNADTLFLLEKIHDWKQYRIPAVVRKAVVVRYYMIRLWRMKNSRDFLHEAVFQMIRWQRDSAKYLSSFGTENVHVGVSADGLDTLGPLKPHQACDFWHFPEDVILETICLTAQALALKNVVPFKDHPANKSQVLPEKCFDEFCRVPRQLGKDIRQALQSECKSDVADHTMQSNRRRSMIVKPESQSFKYKKDDEDSGKQERVSHEGKSSPDLDDLLQSFTPRLLEISAAQEDKQKKKSAEGSASTIWPAAAEALCG